MRHVTAVIIFIVLLQGAHAQVKQSSPAPPAQKPPTGQAKAASEGERKPAGEPERDPFQVSAKLLKTATPDGGKSPGAAKEAKPSFPEIRVCGMMIVGQKRMVTVKVADAAFMSMQQGDRVSLSAVDGGGPVLCVVSDITDRHLLLQLGAGRTVQLPLMGAGASPPRTTPSFPSRATPSTPGPRRTQAPAHRGQRKRGSYYGR